MQLSDADVREFQVLWQKEFNETLSEDEARQKAAELLELYALLARPVPHQRPTHSSYHDEVLPVLSQID